MFSQVTSFDIEDHTMGLFHWFDKSSKWKSLLKNIMSFVTLTIQRLLNLYQFTGCAWKCVLIVNLNNMKAENPTSNLLQLLVIVLDV